MKKIVDEFFIYQKPIDSNIESGELTAEVTDIIESGYLLRRKDADLLACG